MIIGFTGTRKGISRNQELLLRKFFSAFNQDAEIEFHHGCCVGSDTNFHHLVREIFWNCRIIGHPPANDYLMSNDLDFDDVFRPQEYMVRNRHIVDSAEILIATPEGEEILRSGTWATIRYALKKADKSVFIFR